MLGAFFQGNPIAHHHHPTYRREVLSMLPQLKTLDDSEVTPAERLYIRLQHKSELRGSPLSSSSTHSPAQTRPLHPTVVVAPAMDAKLHPIMTDVAVSPVPSTHLLTPDNIHRQRHQQSTRTPPDAPVSTGRDSLNQEPRQTTSVHVDIAAGAVTPTRVKRAGLEEVAAHSDATRGYPERSRKVESASAGNTAVQEHTRLLQNRVAALESILSIQDKSLQHGLVQMGRGQSREGDPDEDLDVVENSAQLYTQLLSTWREKVISLMVQIKSMELARTDHTRELEREAVEVEAARVQLAQECELWRQKSMDVEAQRDLERVRFQEYEQQCTAAERKAVCAVRTLSIEREKLQQVAEAVAFFSAVRLLCFFEMRIHN